MSAGTQAARKVADSPWPERFARLGLAAQGVLYVILGILAVRVAFGHQEKTDQTGALQEIASKPGGAVLLWIIALGLFAYALWRLASAAFGPAADPLADDAKERAKAAAQAVGAAAICAVAVKVAIGSGGGSSGGSKPTAAVLSWPGGQFLVGLVGVIIVVVGGALIWAGWKADFTKELELGQVSAKVRTAVVALGRFGRIARGVVFVALGILVVVAAAQYDPQKANGVDGALKTLAGEPFGKWILTLVALGFVAFGLYGLAQAKLRRMN